MGGRKGKGQQEQNAPRAKKLRRAPPRAVPGLCCTREGGGREQQDGGRREERGADRDAAF